MNPRFLILLLLVTAVVPAQQKYAAQEVMERVRERYSSLDDASAVFSQTMSRRFIKGEQVQRGTAKIKKGNKYRIETDDQKLVSNGQTVWMVSQSNKQVLITSYKENSRLFSPDKFLTGLPDDFLPSGLEENGSALKLILEPKESNAQTRQIKSLTAWVNPATWLVEKIEYVDRSQTTYIITLSNIALNRGLNNKEFEFEPPKDMKVIDQRNIK